MGIAETAGTRTAGGGSRWLPWIQIIAACLLPYANARRAGFVSDDTTLVLEQLGRTEQFNLYQAVTRPYWAAFPEAHLWRPVTSLLLEIEWRIWGNRAFWFHLVNLALHVAVTLLWYLVLRRLKIPKGLALARPCSLPSILSTPRR